MTTVTAMATDQVETEMVEVEQRATCLLRLPRSRAMVAGIRLDPTTKTHNPTLLPTTGFSPIQRWYLFRRFHTLPLPVAAELRRYAALGLTGKDFMDKFIERYLHHSLQ